MFDTLFGWLLDLVAQIWNLVKRILPYLLLAAALYVGFIGGISLTWLVAGLTLNGTAAALALAGASFLFAPGETAAVIADTASAVGDAASSIVAAGVDVIGTGVSAVLTSGPVLMVGAAAFLYWFLSRKQKEEGPAKSDPATGRQEVLQ